MPTRDEAEVLCEVRLQVAAAVGMDGVGYLEPDALISRYEELVSEREGKSASRDRKDGQGIAG